MKYQRHSDTSEAAAEEIESKAATLRAEVYSWIVRCGVHGATDEEVQDALHMVGNTQRPRRVELVESGVVVDSLRRRKTHSGRNAVVWIATKFSDHATLPLWATTICEGTVAPPADTTSDKPAHLGS